MAGWNEQWWHQVKAQKAAERRWAKDHPKTITPAIRAAVYARDGNTCFYCRRALTDGERTLDHILSRKRGGRSNVDNLRVACKPCNSSKHANHEWPADYVCPRRPE